MSGENNGNAVISSLADLKRGVTRGEKTTKSGKQYCGGKNLALDSPGKDNRTPGEIVNAVEVENRSQEAVQEVDITRDDQNFHSGKASHRNRLDPGTELGGDKSSSKKFSAEVTKPLTRLRLAVERRQQQQKLGWAKIQSLVALKDKQLPDQYETKHDQQSVKGGALKSGIERKEIGNEKVLLNTSTDNDLVHSESLEENSFTKNNLPARAGNDNQEVLSGPKTKPILSSTRQNEECGSRDDNDTTEEEPLIDLSARLITEKKEQATFSAQKGKNHRQNAVPISRKISLKNSGSQSESEIQQLHCGGETGRGSLSRSEPIIVDDPEECIPQKAKISACLSSDSQSPHRQYDKHMSDSPNLNEQMNQVNRNSLHQDTIISASDEEGNFNRNTRSAARLNTSERPTTRKTVLPHALLDATHAVEKPVAFEFELEANEENESNGNVSSEISDDNVQSIGLVKGGNTSGKTANIDKCETSQEESMSAQRLVSIFQTCAMRAPSGQQIAIFEQKVSIWCTRMRGYESDTLLALPMTQLRSVTQRHLEYLKRTMWVGPGKFDYYWNNSIGNVILVVVSTDIGMDICDDDLNRHVVWEGDQKSDSRYVYSYKPGKEPSLPVEWIGHDGRYKIPHDTEVYLVDGTVRLTFVSEHTVNCLPKCHLWVMPSQILQEKPEEMSRKDWLQTILITVASATNTAVQAVVRDSFFTMVEKTARNRTSHVRSKIGIVISGTSRQQLLQDTYQQAKFTAGDTPNVICPVVTADSALGGFVVPKEREAMTKYTKIVNQEEFPFSQYNADLLFCCGKVFEESDTNALMHVCPRCCPENEMAGKDLANTICLDFLRERDMSATGNTSIVRHDMCTSPSMYREVRKPCLAAVARIIGKDPSFPIARRGANSAVEKLAKEYFFEWENILITYEMLNIMAVGLVARLDLHESAAGRKQIIQSVLCKYELVNNENRKNAGQRHSRNLLRHKVIYPPSSQKELYQLCAERAARAVEGAYRICTQVLGLRTLHAVFTSTSRCAVGNKERTIGNIEQFFAKYSWHLRPSPNDISSWNGSCEKQERRFQRNIRMDDEKTVEWGMKRLDEKVCLVVMKAMNDLDNLFQDIIIRAKYDFDIWSQSVTKDMRNCIIHGCSEAVDHLVVQILFKHCASYGKGTWKDLNMMQRLERAFQSIAKSRQNIAGSGFEYPIILKMENSSSIELTYISRFFKPSEVPGGRLGEIWEELPAVAFASLKSSSQMYNEEEEKENTKMMIARRLNYRTQPDGKVWQLRGGALVDAFSRMKDGKGVVRMMRNMIYQVLKETGIMEDEYMLDGNEQKRRIQETLSRTVMNPALKVKGKNDDALEEIGDMMNKYLPTIGTEEAVESEYSDEDEEDPAMNQSDGDQERIIATQKRTMRRENSDDNNNTQEPIAKRTRRSR